MCYRMHAMLLIKKDVVFMRLSPLPKHMKLLNPVCEKEPVICMPVLGVLKDCLKDKLIFSGKHEEINN